MAARNPDQDAPLVRATNILELLFHRVLDGMSNAEIVRSTGYPASSVCRDLAALEGIGWIEKSDVERWAAHGQARGVVPGVQPFS